ncbi:hypothetical protein [Salinicola rhizosphaerae]|uniref:Uncharacterized protein n=1 Tax=Salinicola rhizosphaerae TaxID=1443141 RepID=A0ABQ3DS59_9GAMM|nr:hypothetical protein [Salinicola rhizosphaerae]GHB12854.1 hypothetical protein GCM10009038_08590 [Salinicola rhizosphaerae]
MKTRTLALTAFLLAISTTTAHAQESDELTGYEETVGGVYVDQAYCKKMWRGEVEIPAESHDKIVDVCIDIDTGGPEGRF